MGNKIKIYHGCSSLGWAPSLDGLQEQAENILTETGRQKRLDYGVGFYCTEDLNMAELWALLYSKNIDKSTGLKIAYVRSYEFDTSGLRCLELGKDKMKQTLAMYLKYNYDFIGLKAINRDKNLYKELPNMNAMKKVANEFINKYLPNNHNEYDYITGWRADSHYLSIVNDFTSGLINEDNLDEILSLGNFGYQIALMSDRSFKRLKGDTMPNTGERVLDIDKKKLREITKIELSAKQEYDKLIIVE